MIITVEKLAATQAVITKLVEQGQALFTDIGETAHDRARLLNVVMENGQTIAANEGMINGLNSEIADLQRRNRDLEQRNSRLVDDLNASESKLNEATALLDNVRATVTAPA